MTTNIKQIELHRTSVIDLILIDHRYIKECINILTNESSDKRKKFSIMKGFLDTWLKHSLAEKQAVYKHTEKNEELHFNILEAEIEHGIIDQQIKKLKLRIAKSRTLKDEVEAELKVLAELVQRHIREEESEILPIMQHELSEVDLDQMGAEFMKLRKISPKAMGDFPVLQDELIHWKDSVQELSSKFLSKMDNYVENLKH